MELSKFFVKAPLIPVICQDERNGEVLMLGYANEEALRLDHGDRNRVVFLAFAREAVE